MPTSDVPDDTKFKTSSYSGGGGCVEVGRTTDGERVVTVRNRGVHDEVLVFTESEWEAFVRGVKAGEFDLA